MFKCDRAPWNPIQKDPQIEMGSISCNTDIFLLVSPKIGHLDDSIIDA